MTRLVLWDIDHTLVDTRGVGRELFARAFRRATGRAMEQQAKVDGSTEPVIFRETAELHGLATGRPDFEAFARALAEEHVQGVAELRERGHALPGAARLLAAIAGIPGVTQTVVTGNIRDAAEVKLSTFGLDRHLDLAIGAYGEDDDARAKLVRHALERAATDPTDAVLVGDTPADVTAGLDAGVRVVAVATGRSTEPALRTAGAAATLPDLSDTAAALRVLLG